MTEGQIWRTPGVKSLSGTVGPFRRPANHLRELLNITDALYHDTRIAIAE